ncbi:glycoside hydrolase family 3 N-terminal domain-containing protein [Actinosynnema sp. NPDC047251]|uniref:beta-N-acetylhexosaminidase n=1 Tax=Saccharothrix espanaensis (strain ATCC 51144 / DSM 44229 / JCM 9112 / NBRC 15066 / NRRL 15764) TaxID=1179773 RepID=K0JYG4_SACES|nr:glycoside hydrolase family 3 N-terminal domain-containing protein [Saccharothrix espanaensis]CCH31161.1 Glycoside hydrolase family 3 domain protein [Saccharothrix espanaensis DSM 44229]
MRNELPIGRRGGPKTGTRTLLASAALGALLAAVLLDPGPHDAGGQVTGNPVAASAPRTSAESQVSSPTREASPSPPPDPCVPKVAALSLRHRLAQLLMVGVDPRGTADALGLVRGEQVGGIFIGGDDTGLLSAGLDAVRGAAALPLQVAVDDEGGRVQRVDVLDGSIPSAREMAAALSPAQVRVLARDRAAALEKRGVSMDLAPVVDTSGQPASTVIGDRSFSADPAVAAEYALAFAEGLHEVGTTPVLKHFPGHGNTSGDSHQGAVTSPPLDALRQTDLVPYRDIGRYGRVVVMLGHIEVPGLTGGLPATLSPEAYALLRGEFGFTGPAMTDDLGAMRAVTDRVDLPEAVRQALAAGADIALWSSGGRAGEVLDHLEASVAAGTLPATRVDEAARRVLKQKDAC